MQLVFHLEANPAEAEATKQLEVKLMSENGFPRFSISGELSFKLKQPGPFGELMKTNQIIELRDVRFEKAGAYQIAILINGDTKATVPLRPQERPARQS